MFSAKTTVLLAIFAVQAFAHVGYLLNAETPTEPAEKFDKTITTLCNDQPMVCIEPLLHNDFTFVTATETLNKAKYVELLKTKTAKVNSFKLDVANAKEEGAQVDVPVFVGAAIHSHAFLVADASVQGGIALIKIDKTNV